MNASNSNGARLNGFYAYKNTFDDKTTWVAIPKELTFFNTTDPYRDDLNAEDGDGKLGPQTQRPISRPHDPRMQQGIYGGIGTKGLEALSAAALSTPPEADMIFRPASYHRQENLPRSGSPHRSVAADLNASTISSSSRPSSDSFIESQIDPNLVPTVTHGSIAAPSDAGRNSANSEL
ncbi:uncharacterized protein KY384_008209 [Bacidia gigantensis]|uniref:uncharacterized protein n=1 Tax=Bacidia gigantensis TaxID=2732470 RepID=UPI001D03877F|nr:uncharacterized protein KY384_008209 [Bacidia gigantensis]KAG8526780.1 hypothetical protein KY384_008209 [Bacidia gigantensis]